MDLGGNWKTTFSPGVTEDEYPAIGMFQRTGDIEGFAAMTSRAEEVAQRIDALRVAEQ